MRSPVWTILVTGFLIATVGGLHLRFVSFKERKQFESVLQHLSGMSLALVEMPTTDERQIQATLSRLLSSFPEVGCIVGNEASPGETAGNQAWVVGVPIEPSSEGSAISKSLLSHSSVSERLPGHRIEVQAKPGMLEARQLSAQWPFVYGYSAALCLCLGLVTLLIWGLGRERVRELDALTAMLKAEQERLANLINSVRGVVWERDPESGWFTLLSGSADGFLGFSKSQWRSEAGFWVSRVHKSDRAKIERDWKAFSQRLGSYELVYQVKAADGRLRYIEEDGVCVKLTDGKSVFRGVFTDITEKFEFEAAAAESRRIQVENSRQAGMAELATGVLHNVGNILNTLNVNARLLRDQLQDSRVHQLHKASKLLEENLAGGAAFFSNDPRGRALPGYLVKVSDFLIAENSRLQGQMHEVLDRVEHIRDVIVLQQKHGKVRRDEAKADLVGLVQDALRLEADALSNGGVEVETHFPDLPTLAMTKSHVLQVLVNLINNARHAVADNGVGGRQIKVSISPPADGKVAITVRDNGCGIPKSRLSQIFNHGFTTRIDGHGFGLHHAGLLAQDMGGRLFAESDGSGKGASFTLELPFIETTSEVESRSMGSRVAGGHRAVSHKIAEEICA